MKFDIKRIATLAKLQLTPKEELQYQPELEDILNHAEILEEVPTENVLPTNQSTGVTGQMREDTVYNSGMHAMHEELLSSSKHKNNNFIKLPPVL